MFRLQSYKKIADSKRFRLYFYIFVVNSNAKDVNSNAKHEPIGLFDIKIVGTTQNEPKISTFSGFMKRNILDLTFINRIYYNLYRFYRKFAPSIDYYIVT